MIDRNFQSKTILNCRGPYTKAAALLLLAFFPFSAQSTEINAFNTLNLIPMVQIFGLPSLTNQIQGTKHSVEVQIEQQTANYHSQSSTKNEAIKLDGETWRTSLNVSYALTDSAELSISAPFVKHSTGYLDELIYRWHDLFGMPQGARTESNQNSIDLQYSVNGNQQVDIASSVSGVGDIRIKYAHQLPAFKRTLILQTELKLPTGGIDTLTGSGGTDLSIGFMINDAVTFERQNINTWAGAAVTHLGEIDGTLSESQKDLAWSARAGLGWSINKSFAFKAQLDTHSVVYNSHTTELSDPALMLTFGGEYYFSPDYRLELSAVEDIITETSPDIIFSAKFSAKFK